MRREVYLAIVLLFLRKGWWKMYRPATGIPKDIVAMSRCIMANACTLER